MKIFMTGNTNSNNVKPMFGFISEMVMIFMGLISTRALKIIGSWQFSGLHGVIDRHSRFNCIWIEFPAIGTIVYLVCFTFFALRIKLSCLFAFIGLFIFHTHNMRFKCFSITRVASLTFFALSVAIFGLPTFVAFFVFKLCFLTFIAFSINYILLICAIFATRTDAVFVSTMFMKFRQRLDFLAFGTSLCYDCLRHGCFSIKQLCLEPVAGTQLASGSHYSTRDTGGRQC